jgi:pimeloyl-ACP methyl ester carboxylesterase
MQIDEYFIQIEGREIYAKRFLRNRDKHTPTIVFLHDALGSVAQWKDYPRRILNETKCNVLLYDRFGHGLSSAEPIAPDERFLDKEALVILPEVLHHFSISHPILYGHSDGGTIAMIYASRIHSSGLILEAAHVLVEKETREGVLQTSMQKDTLVAKLNKYHGEKALDLFNYWSNLWTSDLMLSWNIEHVLNRIDIPTLIIQGANDNYGTREQVNRISEGVSGNVEVLWLEHCSHFPPQRENG